MALRDRLLMDQRYLAGKLNLANFTQTKQNAMDF